MSTTTAISCGKYATGIAAIVRFTAELLNEEAGVPEIRVPRSFASAALHAKATIRLRLDRAKNTKTVAQLLALMALVLPLLVSGATLSQRDVYYCLKHIFKSQRECNASILMLGLVLNLKRHQMAIVPATRGFAAGNFRFSFRGAAEDCIASDWCDVGHLSNGDACVSVMSEWISADPFAGTLRIEVPDSVTYIIVVEKEGVFRRLIEDGFHSAGGGCILVTGCGYPDVATRAFVSKVSSAHPRLLVFGVCDYNPHGVALLQTFRHASSRSNFEAADFVARIKWLGLRGAQVRELLTGRGERLPADQVQSLTLLDNNKIRSMLRKGDHVISPDVKDELHVMLNQQVKIELEALFCIYFGSLSAALAYWIEVGDFIE